MSSLLKLEKINKLGLIIKVPKTRIRLHLKKKTIRKEKEKGEEIKFQRFELVLVHTSC
jgi:hypothetical protein